MTRNLLDLLPCSACAAHVGYWQPPAYMCPACLAVAATDKEASCE